MKIAVFGREETVNRVISLCEDSKDIEILPLIFKHPSETPDLIERAFNYDIYLFTDELAYIKVRNKIEKKRLPTVKVDLDAFTIATTLYRVLKNDNKPIENIGLDLVNDHDVYKILEELGINKENIHLFTHHMPDHSIIEEIIHNYEELWEKQQVNHIFTISEDVYQALQHKQIPVHLFEVPKINLEKVLNQAVDLINLQNASNNLVVTGIISLSDLENPSTEKHSQHIRDILNKFTEQTNSSFFEDNQQRFIITGTDKLHNHLRKQYREFPLLNSFISNINDAVFMGFGLGLSAKEASEHAEISLNYCKKSNDSICYIVNERGDTIGPIGIKKEIDTSRLYHALIHQAKLNNELSYNFINFIKERNQESFSSNDIALYFNVTKRSAERTLNKLLTGDVIFVSGEERPYVKGRPRKLYRLK